MSSCKLVNLRHQEQKKIEKNLDFFVNSVNVKGDLTGRIYVKEKENKTGENNNIGFG